MSHRGEIDILVWLLKGRTSMILIFRSEIKFWKFIFDFR